MPDMIPVPSDFEPVVDIVCGQVAFYVQITHNPAMYLSDFRKLWPDGSPTASYDYLHCGSCNRRPSQESINQNGIRRDEHGVRRLW